MRQLVDRARAILRRPGGRASALVAVVTALLAYRTLATMVRTVGHPAAALDDAYIHFQYARAIVQGHPLRFQAGEPISTGATSFLWPVLLAPFWAVGLRGEAIVWAAWALSFVSLGMLAHEANELTRPLAGRAAAACAAAMVLAFGGFLWGAASGMEVVPFAWVMARAARRGGEWAEGERTTARQRELVVLAVAAPCMRPEGALFSVALAAVLVGVPRLRSLRGRAFGLVALAVPVLQPLVLRALTGSGATSTASVKLLAGNPYFQGAVLRATVVANVRVFFLQILQGEVWSAEFLPHGGALVALLGLVAIGVCATTTRRFVRGALVLLLALGMLVPCTYVTFLWNRLRYLWPFATGWIVGLACLARVLGDALARWSPRMRIATPIAGGIFAGLFASHLAGVIDDLADSARAIDRQQATLGRWARAHLPETARIGVNDTGAIAYFSDRHTFDVVGLTTPTEGRYWVAGAASRVEHYERMQATNPSALPTHFIVYPAWFGCDALLGERLTEAEVHATILGGAVMEARVADYDLLGSGRTPWSTRRTVVDDVDVADLESEAAHHYDLLGARDGDELVRAEPPGVDPPGTDEAPADSENDVLDGGRTNRARDRFEVDATNGTFLVARLEATADLRVTVRVDDAEIGSEVLPGGMWCEVRFALPSERAHRGARVDVQGSGAFASYHYWIVGSPP